MVTNQVFDWPLLIEKARRLTLAPDGTLHVGSDPTDTANWYRVYCQGDIYQQEFGTFVYSGEKPIKPVMLDIFPETITVFTIEDVELLLRSVNPVIDEGTKFFAVLRYQDMLILVVAVGSISRASVATIIHWNEANEVFLLNRFASLLHRCDPELESRMLTSQKVK